MRHKLNNKYVKITSISKQISTLFNNTKYMYFSIYFASFFKGVNFLFDIGSCHTDYHELYLPLS